MADLRIMSQMLYHCATPAGNFSHFISPTTSHQILTAAIRIMNLVIYHCANAAGHSVKFFAYFSLLVPAVGFKLLLLGL